MTRPDPWLTAHHQAMAHPNPTELPIVRMYEGLCLYPRAYQRSFGVLLGEDYVLGPAWLDMVATFRRLLNGPTGRLDCGTLDSAIIAHARAHGLEVTP